MTPHAQWLDSDRVIFGTKDNQLIVWNVRTGRHCEMSPFLDALKKDKICEHAAWVLMHICMLLLFGLLLKTHLGYSHFS
jgi:hypothetical protein